MVRISIYIVSAQTLVQDRPLNKMKGWTWLKSDWVISTSTVSAVDVQVKTLALGMRPLLVKQMEKH